MVSSNGGQCYLLQPSFLIGILAILGIFERVWEYGLVWWLNRSMHLSFCRNLYYQKQMTLSVSKLFSAVICQFWLCQLQNFRWKVFKMLDMTGRMHFCQPCRKLFAQSLKIFYSYKFSSIFSQNIPSSVHEECNFDSSSENFSIKVQKFLAPGPNKNSHPKTFLWTHK